MDIAVNDIPPVTQSTTASGLTVRPMTWTIGAEIDGVDASKPVPGAVAQDLNDLLNKWKVIFFRDQDITPQQHIEFAGTFGPVIGDYDVARDPDHAQIQAVKPSVHGHVNEWHTDTSWMVRPAKAAILRGIVIPEVGGDTMWADGVAAYNGLPDDVKEKIESLDLIHDASNIGQYYKDHPDYRNKKENDRVRRIKNPLVAHPLVRTHPETGERSLFINANLSTHIVGMVPSESRELLAYLMKQYTKPEYTVRFKWRRNSIAVWDQRQTQHYAVTDYPLGTPRLLNRILVASDDIPHR